ncbi:fungal-specific transcription factor domain-containing protein [Schizophyllum fasciatum]
MSSNEEDSRDYADDGQDYKKRRVQRACDQCRRKKSDGVQSNGKPCSNCSAYGYDCTYIQTAKEGPSEEVEPREPLGEDGEAAPADADFSHELGDDIGREHWASKPPPPVDPSPLVGASSDPHLIAKIASNLIRTTSDTQHIRASLSEDIEPEDNDYSSLQMTEQFKRLKLDNHDIRFFGRSSGAMLVQAAVDLKGEITSVSSDDFWERGLGSRRAEFWQLHPWEVDIMTRREFATYTFPEDDLLYSLVELYFKEINTYLPLLHKPSFIGQLVARRHLTDEFFAPIVLLVCAIGARFTKDPRVLLDDSTSFHSAETSPPKWFNQVQIVKKSMFTAPTLHDLQFYMLSVAFLQATSAPQACWTLIGIAVRMAQDVGAHRRRISKKPQTMEDELWKRAFYVTVFTDRACSGALGRPCATQEEDFDLDFPTECDDEYWDHPDPEKAWKQPPGRPSYIAFFNSMLALHEILAICLRTIYSINKSKILYGFVGQKWEQQIVAELDSALNKWVDSVPDHLRWDPNREDEVFFNQSVQLYATYYHVQILVHRPFIPSPRKPSPLSFPSLAICANAARSLIHIVDIHLRRTGASHPSMTSSIFTAGIVLLLNIWGGKRSGLSTDPNKNGWHTAGRLWDILYELASVGDLALPTPSPQPQKKRERDSDTSGPPTSRSSPSSEQGPRAIAGSRRVTRDASTMGSGSSSGASSQLFSLPMHSDELGRLPLHGQVSFFTRPEHQQQHASSVRTDFSSWYGQGAGMAGPATHATYGLTAASSFYDQLGSALEGHTLDPAFQANHPMAGEQAATVPAVNLPPGIDTDTMAMWSNAPTNFEVNDWGAYLTNELNNGMPSMQ